MLFLPYQRAKVRISERKTKGKGVFLFVFPSESTFEVYLKGTNKRAKNQRKRSISFCLSAIVPLSISFETFIPEITLPFLRFWPITPLILCISEPADRYFNMARHVKMCCFPNETFCFHVRNKKFLMWNIVRNKQIISGLTCRVATGDLKLHHSVQVALVLCRQPTWCNKDTKSYAARQQDT